MLQDFYALNCVINRNKLCTCCRKLEINYGIGRVSHKCIIYFRFLLKPGFRLDPVTKWSTRRGLVRNVNKYFFVTNT
jgi:hypothetical protein